MTLALDNQYDPKTAGIVDAFVSDGMGRKKEGGETQKAQPLSLTDYKETCKYFLGNQPLLSDALLEARIRYIYDDSKLKDHFKPGYKVCPVIIPFSNMGMPLSKDELQSGGYLKLLIVNEKGETLAGFGNEVCSTFAMLPPEIQNLAFTIGTYERPESHLITPNDRTKIAQQYTTAYRSLEALLR